jgi:hypothetical protein
MRDIDLFPWAPELVSCAQRAVRNVLENLKKNTPALSEHVLRWLSARCDLARPEEYFLLPGALTLFTLPWWLELSLRSEVDADFQASLMESSTNLYYFARTLDDVMDDHEAEATVFPGLYPFLINFQAIFFNYFPASNGFWLHFHSYLNEMAEVTSLEASTEDMDEQLFTAIAGRKAMGAMAPVAAVCYRYDRPDQLAAWESCFRVFACWHQFRDDLLDWSEDAERGTCTWLLSEAKRRRLPEESVAMWMGREGFDWAGRQLAVWMVEMKQKAAGLNSPELLRYLEMREKTCTAEVAFLGASAAAWARLMKTAPVNG